VLLVREVEEEYDESDSETVEGILRLDPVVVQVSTNPAVDAADAYLIRSPRCNQI
jgi:hypothetical protein